MELKSIDSEMLRIRVHHVGGIGGYGPSEALNALGHIQWVVYDADQDALAGSDTPGGKNHLMIHRGIGGKDGQAEFHLTAAPSASSLLRPATGAEDYSLPLPDGTLRKWGRHTEIRRTVSIAVNTLDTLISRGEAPQIDFLSIDAQGAELGILEGASVELQNRVVGVLCEVEFTELYEGQALFGEIQNRLWNDRMRLCDIFRTQHLNSNDSAAQFLGKGFLTVGEALFLKAVRIDRGSPINPSPEAVVQRLKLAAIAVAFDQVDYAVELCRTLIDEGVVDFIDLAERTEVGYVKMLRDLVHEAEQSAADEPPWELEYLGENSGSASGGSLHKLARLAGAAGLLVFAVLGKIGRAVFRIDKSRRYSNVGKILHRHGLSQVAFDQYMRTPKYRRLVSVTRSVWRSLLE